MKALLLLPLLALLPGPALAQLEWPKLDLANPAGVIPAPAPLSPARLPARFDASLDERVRDGVVSPVERALIRSGSGTPPFNVPANQACSSGALSPQECSSGLRVRLRGNPNTISGPTTKPLSPNEKVVLQRIRSSSYTPQWRTYGQCSYDWSGWKLHTNGIRTTGVDCGGTAMRWQIGVSCDRLMVNIRSRDATWNGWEPPAGPEDRFRRGEDQMVASLCANALPAPVPAPAAAEVKP